MGNGKSGRVLAGLAAVGMVLLAACGDATSADGARGLEGSASAVSASAPAAADGLGQHPEAAASEAVDGAEVRTPPVQESLSEAGEDTVSADGFLEDLWNKATGQRLVGHCHLRTGTNCSGQGLAGGDFSIAILTGANFAGAILTGANFNGTDLTGANFTGADLTGASFEMAHVSGTVFTRANLTKAKIYTLIPALNPYFMGADLTRAGVHGIFQGADFTGAIVRGTNLSGSSLFGPNFTNADLRPGKDGDGLWRTSLRDADMTGDTLTGANLTNVAWMDGRICKEGSIGACL